MLPVTAPIGATFPIEGAIYVGYQGKGTLDISNGGTVSCGYGYIAALSPPEAGTGSNGVVTVDGNGSSWTLTGDGNSRKLYVGGIGFSDGGTALLSITNGGNVTVNNPNDNYAAWVGASGTLTGNATVAKNGSGFNSRLLVVVGTLAPTKSLTIDGNLGFNSPATTVCDVTPEDVNVTNVDVVGTAVLNGRLSVTMNGTFTPRTRFTLLHARDGLSYLNNNSRFSSVSIKYPTHQPFRPVIEYDYAANNVYLYLMPDTI